MTVVEQRPIGLLGQEETFDRVTLIVSFYRNADARLRVRKVRRAAIPARQRQPTN